MTVDSGFQNSRRNCVDPRIEHSSMAITKNRHSNMGRSGMRYGMKKIVTYDMGFSTYDMAKDKL